MPEPLLYLKAMGVAAIVSAISVLAMVRARRSASTTWLNAACVAGISLGLVCGYSVLSLQLAWPPANGLERFLTIVLPAALVIELMAGFQRVPSWVAWLLRTSLAATIPRILLHGSVYLSSSNNGWTLLQAGTTLAVCGTLLAGSWGLLSWLSHRCPGVSISFALCLSIGCAGLAVMMAGYIKGGAAAFPLVATLATMSIGARLLAKERGKNNFAICTLAPLGRGQGEGVEYGSYSSRVPKRSIVSANFGTAAILGIAVVGLFGLLFIGRFFGRLSTGSALAMLLAPLMCWATETPLVRYRRPWFVVSLRLVLVAIPLVVVLAVAKRDFDRHMAPLLGKVSDCYDRSILIRDTEPHLEHCTDSENSLSSISGESGFWSCSIALASKRPKQNAQNSNNCP